MNSKIVCAACVGMLLLGAFGRERKVVMSVEWGDDSQANRETVAFLKKNTVGYAENGHPVSFKLVRTPGRAQPHITVTGPNGAFTKTITQPPKPVPTELVKLAGDLPSGGGELTVKLPEGYWVKADTDSPWLTLVTCEEGKLVVSAGPNPSDDQTRTALVHIYLSDGSPLADVTITQVAG